MSDWYSAAQFRSWLDGKYDKHREDIAAYRHAGLTHGDAQAFLSFAESVYGYEAMTEEHRDVLPADITESRLWRIITGKQSTEVATEALHSRNQSVIDGMVGLQGQGRVDFSGLGALQRLRNLIAVDEQVFGAIVAGLMGSGKTDFAGLLVELWIDANPHRRCVVATNIPSFGEDANKFKQEFGAELRYVNDIEQVDDLLVEGHDARREEEEGGAKAPKYLLLMDEGAQFLDAKTSQKRANTLGKMLRLARKAFVNTIIIGQRDIDIAPDVREVCNLFVKKTSKKKAEFYEGVESGGEWTDEMMKIKDIPPTSIPIRTTDAAFFRFEDGFEFSLEDDTPGEEVEEEEDDPPQRCRGTNKRGERCGVTGDQVMDNGFCVSHQPDEDDEDEGDGE